MLLRSWKRVVAGALVVVAVLGVNALARSAPRSARSISAAHRSAVDPAQSVSAAHHAAAIANADQILGALVLPPGSDQVEHAPNGAELLDQRPFVQLFYQAQVDPRRYWVSGASESSDLSSISSHLPPGSGSGGSATDGDDAEYAYELPTIDRRTLGQRQLVVHMVQLSNRQTAVRIDAEVQYFAPWKQGQRIPRAARFLQTTEGPADSQSPRVVRTVTDPMTVRHIAALIEALPFEGNDNGLAFSCPDALATNPVDWFTFRATPEGPVLAKLSEAATAGRYPDPCDDPSLTIRGHDDPPIAGGGQLLTEVDRLLGVRLTAR